MIPAPTITIWARSRMVGSGAKKFEHPIVEYTVGHDEAAIVHQRICAVVDVVSESVGEPTAGGAHDGVGCTRVPSLSGASRLHVEIRFALGNRGRLEPCPSTRNHLLRPELRE